MHWKIRIKRIFVLYRVWKFYLFKLFSNVIVFGWFRFSILYLLNVQFTDPYFQCSRWCITCRITLIEYTNSIFIAAQYLILFTMIDCCFKLFFFSSKLDSMWFLVTVYINLSPHNIKFIVATERNKKLKITHIYAQTHAKPNHWTV